jgi:hypothetical protein
MTDFVIAIECIIFQMPFDAPFQCDETVDNGGSFECPIFLCPSSGDRRRSSGE